MISDEQRIWFEKYSPGFFYNGNHKKEIRELFVKVPRLLEIRKGRVLDIGFGSTSELFNLSENMDVDYVVGIDVYEKKMKKLAHELKDYGTYRVFQGDINALDFEDNTFNAIFSFDSLFFANNLNDVIAQMAKCLTKKGELVLSVSFQEKGQNLLAQKYEASNIPLHYYSEGQICLALESAKLSEIITWKSTQGNLFISAHKK